MLTSRFSSTTVSIHVATHIRHHARPPLSLPLTLSAIPIIPYLHRASIFILPRLCCGYHCIILHLPVYSAAGVCIPSRVGYSPRSGSLCTTLLASLCSTLLFSLSALIFSHWFSFFCQGSSLSVWFSRSAPICPVFLYLSSFRSAPIWAFHSALSYPICLIHIWSDELKLLRSCSDLLDSICLDHITQICYVFRSSVPSNFSSNNSPLHYTSHFLSMYYNIEFINNLDIKFIVIVVKITQYLTRNDAGILVLNRNPDSHFCPGCADFEISSKLNLLSKKNR